MKTRLLGLPIALLLGLTTAACSDDSTPPPVCRVDGDCLAGQLCRMQACVEPECRTDDDCAGGALCTDGVCLGGSDVVDASTDTDAGVDAALDASDAADGSGDAADVGADTAADADAGDADVPDIDWGPLEFTTDPEPRATNVSRDAVVRVTFNQPMFDLSFTQANVRLGPPFGEPVERTIAWDSETFTLTVTPTEPLEPASPWVFRLSEFVGTASGARLGEPWTMEFSTATYDGADYHRFLARAYAPVVMQQVESSRVDTFTTIDFDGDLLPGNNHDHAVGTQAGRLYYAVVESTTHWFITYVFYYPVVQPNDRDEAEHDMFWAQMVVQKLDGDPTGVLRAWSTFYRLDYGAWAMESPWYTAGAEVGGDLDGRLPAARLEGSRHVTLFVESGHHAICLPDTGIGRCRPATGATAPFEEGTTAVYYRAGDTAQAIGEGPADDLRYSLEPFVDGLWVYRNRTTGPEAVFGGRSEYGAPADGGALRPGDGLSFPTALQSEHDGDTFGSLPFTYARADEFPPREGVWFVDPAWMASQTFTMPEGIGLDYCFNPWLGIDVRDELAGCTSSSFEVD